MADPTQAPEPKPRYLWPWFLAAAVLLGVMIAVISVRAEANRIKSQRSFPLPATDK